MKNNPWGPSGGSGDGGDGAGNGGGSGGGGPRNPWSPPPGGPRGGGGGGRGNIEDLFRRRRGGGGGGGPPRFPVNLDNRKIWKWIILGFVILWLLLTSLWRLSEEQQGVVTRFGNYVRTVGPGINLTMPYPIEKLEKVNVSSIRTTEIGNVGDERENLVLTSDQNIIDLAYEVRWSVKDSRAFLFRLDDPERTVREVAESAMRAAVANFSLTDAIGPGRGEIEMQVRDRMQRILDSYGAGVTIQSITVRESDPPSEVKEAFRNVNAAQQRRESYMNQARAYAQQVTERAEGDATAFNKVYEEYRLAPEVTRRRMYYETMENILQNADKTVVEANGVTPYLPLPEVRRRSQSSGGGNGGASNDATTAEQAGSTSQSGGNQ